MKKTHPASLILIMEAGLAAPRRNRIRSRLEELGVSVRHVEGGERSYLEVTGDELPIRTLHPECWDGVASVVPLSPAYPHAAWGGGRGTGLSSTGLSPTVVALGNTALGGGQFAVMAGPCAIEDQERTIALAHDVARAGATIFRGGACKPRTSPYAFQGLEDEGLRILAETRAATGLPVVTEVLDPRHIDRVLEHADMLQVGSRNMQNYALLKELGRIRRPVLLKRGYAASVDELLLAAEYILTGGNDQVVLCERGVRSASGASQVILDLGAVPEIRRRSHLPVVIDPSHAAVWSYRVAPLARAAVAAGADGLLVEVHDEPDRALSDGRQALSLAQFASLMRDVRIMREALLEVEQSSRVDPRRSIRSEIGSCWGNEAGDRAR